MRVHQVEQGDLSAFVDTGRMKFEPIGEVHVGWYGDEFDGWRDDMAELMNDIEDHVFGDDEFQVEREAHDCGECEADCMFCDTALGEIA